jgi:hypothetical protein
MYICSDGHEEICHETRGCPLCVMIKEKDKEISAKDDEIQALQSRIENAESDA